MSIYIGERQKAILRECPFFVDDFCKKHNLFLKVKVHGKEYIVNDTPKVLKSIRALKLRGYPFYTVECEYYGYRNECLCTYYLVFRGSYVIEDEYKKETIPEDSISIKWDDFELKTDKICEELCEIVPEDSIDELRNLGCNCDEK